MIFEERVEVYFDKRKITVYLLLSLVFISLGIRLTTEPGTLLLLGLIPVSQMTVGIIATGIFAISAYALIRRWMRKLPVLIIDEKGIYDYMITPSGIEIPWASIYDAEIRRISMRQRIVILSLYDAAAFIEQLPAGYRKKVAGINYKSIGSPATINASGLTIKPEELLQLLKDRIETQNRPA